MTLKLSSSRWDATMTPPSARSGVNFGDAVDSSVDRSRNG